MNKTQNKKRKRPYQRKHEHFVRSGRVVAIDFEFARGMHYHPIQYGITDTHTLNASGSLVQSKSKILPIVTKMTGIKNRHLKEGLSKQQFKQTLKEEFSDTKTIVVWGGHSDILTLEEFKLIKTLKFVKIIDLQHHYQAYVNSNNAVSLVKAYEHIFGKVDLTAHNAVDDTIMIAKIFQEIYREKCDYNPQFKVKDGKINSEKFVMPSLEISLVVKETPSNIVETDYQVYYEEKYDIKKKRIGYTKSELKFENEICTSIVEAYCDIYGQAMNKKLIINNENGICEKQIIEKRNYNSNKKAILVNKKTTKYNFDGYKDQVVEETWNLGKLKESVVIKKYDKGNERLKSIFSKMYNNGELQKTCFQTYKFGQLVDEKINILDEE